MKGLIVCVCQDICSSFSKIEFANKFRSEKKVNFAIIHPQLCATNSDNFWRVLRSGADKVTRFVIVNVSEYSGSDFSGGAEFDI